jgi:tyrosinase
LTRIHDWPAFSNHSVGDGGSTSNSIEAIHDGIHGNVGAGGQMSDPSVAGMFFIRSIFFPLLKTILAFDPIFFLHHCNVDRLLQLWSALNPGVWVTRNQAETGTYTIPANTPVDQSTGQ